MGTVRGHQWAGVVAAYGQFFMAIDNRGLVPAVESLASRSSVPVAVSVTLDESFGLSAVERSAYFVMAELLANIDKHAGASVVSVTLASEGGLHGAPMLEITVSDNGTGGATTTPEHGLAGLRERVLGLRGSLNIDSPAGGPTIVTARIPVDDLDGGPAAPALPQPEDMTSRNDGTSAGPVRIVLAEDSLLLREGLVRLFDEAGFEILASYGDADALLSGIDNLQPDLAVLDVRMPPTFRDEGVKAAVSLRRTHPSVGVLLLSQYAEEQYATELLAAGDSGVGYLLKDRISSLNELREAVTRIAAGGTVLDEQIVRQMFARRRDPLTALTPRERDVLGLMAEGLANQGIASALVVGVGSVEKHVASIFAKLGIDDTGSSHRRVLAWLQR
jgi:DNA-binding NarL/FixJ family response regulator